MGGHSWSNIHYGYLVGESVTVLPDRFEKWCAHGCPGVGQDNPLDQPYVRFGYDLSKEIDGTVTRETFIEAITPFVYQWSTMTESDGAPAYGRPVEVN